MSAAYAPCAGSRATFATFAAFVVLALLVAACGRTTPRGPEPPVVAPTDASLAALLPPLAALPAGFLGPEPLDGFPLPPVLVSAVERQYFAAYTDRAGEAAREFLVIGVAVIAEPDILDGFFAIPGSVFRLLLSEQGVTPPALQVLRPAHLGEAAVTIRYATLGGQQDIVVFQRGRRLGWLARLQPIDTPGRVDLERLAAVLDEILMRAGRTWRG